MGTLLCAQKKADCPQAVCLCIRTITCLESTAKKGHHHRKHQPHHCRYAKKTTALTHKSSACLSNLQDCTVNRLSQSSDTSQDRAAALEEIQNIGQKKGSHPHRMDWVNELGQLLLPLQYLLFLFALPVIPANC